MSVPVARIRLRKPNAGMYTQGGMVTGVLLGCGCACYCAPGETIATSSAAGVKGC